jgi:hypothetical protein
MSGSLKGGMPNAYLAKTRREIARAAAEDVKTANARFVAKRKASAVIAKAPRVVERAKIDRDAVTAWLLVALAAAGWACYFLGTPQ